MILGSANIGAEYGGHKYGNNFFYDINIKAENIDYSELFEYFLYLKETGGLKKSRTKNLDKYLMEFN